MKKESSSKTTSIVLLYHRLGLPKLSSIVAGQYVVPRLFVYQLDWLKRSGWKLVSLEEMIGLEYESDRIAITFDDAFQNVYEHAYPALMDRDMKAAIYVVADAIGGNNEWDKTPADRSERIMSVAQIREMSDAGFEIGSHSLTHPHLTCLDDHQLKSELVDSKKKIEDITGREVISFSYPYGDCDERVIAAAIEAGYKYAMGTKLGVVDGANLFDIPRVNVRWSAIPILLRRKIARAINAAEICA